MSTDPASLNVTMGFTGLSITELNVLLSNATHGSKLEIDVNRLGTPRYQAQVSGLPLQSAASMCHSLFNYLRDLEKE